MEHRGNGLSSGEIRAGRRRAGVQRALERLAAFRGDERGTIAIIFALMTIIVMGTVGGAIDYGRAVTARDQTQTAVDAAVLAAARIWQTEKDMALAEQKAILYYNSTKPHGVNSSISSFVADPNANVITLQATTSFNAPFLSAAASIGNTVRGLPATTVEYRVTASAQAMLAVGGNSELNLEISMMLDVTGSMGGQKLTDLKDAAKDLIDIVVWNDQSNYTSKVALVPFSDHINAGVYTSALTGLPTTHSVTTTTTTGRGRNKQTVTTTTTTDLIQCVTERAGVDQFTDEDPHGPNSYMGPADPQSTNVADQYTSGSTACPKPVSEIMPLSNDKNALKQRIDTLVANGNTSGSLGTQMAWYMLSPKWASIWPAGSQPVAYNTPKHQKIAVLMTDGEYNRYLDKSASVSTVNSYAQSICTGMKQAGISVYTVGFQLGNNNTAINMLRDCASNPTQFYEASDGAALRQAFRDIALQLAKLRLTQ